MTESPDRKMPGYWVIVLLTLLTGIVLGFFLLFWLSGFSSHVFLVLKALSSVFLVIGVVYAARQFHLNQKQLRITGRWNRQHTAMIETNKANDKIDRIINVLKKLIDYGERKEPYKISEIHLLFGNFDGDGKNFTFSKKGHKAKQAIISLLNTFEYIATGVNLEIFDETVAKKLWKGKLVYAYTMFSSYISHLREEHGWEKVYTELEKLAKRWEKEEGH